MEYQKFIPEGWIEKKDEFTTIDDLRMAFNEDRIIQGFVNNCDSNYNLHVDLGNNVKGIIPRNEVDAINIDEYGFCKTNLCKNKVNSFIQFKVKEIYDDNSVILSRKMVGQDALSWMKEDLKPGMILNRNSKKY